MGTVTENEPKVRVGTSGWKKPMWRGYFYRRGLVQSRELEYASSHLSSLEINTTFHGLPRPSSYQNWHSGTPDDFVFAVKGNKAVTHDHRLRNPVDGIADFLASGVFELEEKLGPILWQTPPSLPFHRDTVETFLATLPHSTEEARQLIAKRGDEEASQAQLDIPDRRIRHALEVRHPSFANPAFIELLRRYDVAAVATNSPGWPVIRDVTSDFVYVRLHGSADHYPDGYDDATLDYWAGLVNGWLSGEGWPDGRGRDVFVYFDNPDNEGINSPFDAMRLLERLGGPAAARIDTAIQPPLW
jgi:uncharacterized protein YecE (DUF72 family)